MSPKLSLRLLGPPQVWLEGREIGVSRRKSRAVVYYLAGQDEPVLRQALLSIFWADLAHTAAGQTLRTTLTGLRRALGEGLVVQGDRVGLAEDAWVDAREFERRLTAVPVNPDELSGALELYRGEFLEGFTLAGAQPFEDWLVVHRERYRRLAMRGWSTLAGHYEARGDFRAALECLESALAADRLQEDLQRDVMRLLYLAGDRPAAIRRYDELRRLLDDEMGVPPMAETRRLYDDLLNDRLAAGKTAPAAPRAVARQATAPRLAMLVRRSPTPPGPQALPFTGRAAELQLVREIVESPRLALIEGEAGVGKTRLAEQFLFSYAAETGALPLVSRARELEHSLPYLPLVEALRELIASPAWEELRTQVFATLPAIWLSEVGRLAPEIGAASAPGGASPAADEARLWEGVRQFLLALAAQRPLLILVDDLQWLDSASLGLLAYVLRLSADSPLRFIATMRPSGRKSTAAFLQTLTREDRIRRINLERLSLHDVDAIAAAISPQDAAPLAAWLYAVSEGNAYILNELLRFARQNGILDEAGRMNQAALPEGPVVPHTVFSLIQSRLDRLSDETRRVLNAAVAQGREFEFPVVARASGLSEAAALDALDELQAAGLIEPREGNWFRFDHPLTMEVAYQETGELRHRRMHRRVAEALEQLHLDRLDEVAGRLAWHFFEGDAPERGARYALQAAANAARLAAWDETIELYELALRGLSGAARLPALVGLGQAQLSAGHFARASEVFREALALAAAVGAPPIQVDPIRLALARAMLPQARFAEAIELAREMALSPMPETAIMGEVTWGTALSIEGADLDAAGEHLRRAQELWVGGRGLDPALLAQVQFELGSLAAQQGDLETAIGFYRQSLATASSVEGDHALEQRILSYNNLAYHLHLLGDASAAQYARQGVELAQEKGQLGLLTYLYSTQGEIALAAGDLDAAEERFNAGLELAQRFAVPERIAGLTANLGLAALRRGYKELAIYQLSQALGLADALGARHLAAQVRVWLAPLLPAGPAHRRLAEARAFAESTGRKLLLDEIARAEAEIAQSQNRA